MSTVIDSSSLHKYRTEIPNILFEMDLDPFELSFYLYLKRTAGDKGKCWKSNKTLASESKISIRKINYLKISLEKKGLIKITQRKTKDGDQDSSIIEIVDLWPKNFAHFLKPNEDISKPKGVVHNMHNPMQDMQDGTAPNANKEDHSEEDLKNIDIVPSVSDLVQHLFFKYNEYRKSLNLEPCDNSIITKNWNVEAKRLLNNYPKEKLINLINFAFADEFWKAIISTPSGLRKNIRQLETLQAKTKQAISSPNNNFEYAKSIALKLKNLEGSGRRKMEANAFRAYFEINFIGCENSKPFTLEYTDINFKAKLSEEVKRYNI